MEEYIKNWFRMNNNHPEDNERFFDIVIDSEKDAVERDVFEEAMRQINENVSEEEVDNAFCKYQDLREFLLYLHR